MARAAGSGTRQAATAALALLVTACSAPAMTAAPGGPGEHYARDTVAFVIGQGPIPTEIHGNPSALDDAAFAALVLEKLRLPPVWGPHEFAAEPDPGHRYRLVLAFNPELAAGASPAEQPDAPPYSADRTGIRLCAGKIDVHEGGPYPPLPVEKLESVREIHLTPFAPPLFGERVLVRGAFCLGDVPIASDFAEMREPEDYGDPEFDQLLQLLLWRLMPYRDLPATE